MSKPIKTFSFDFTGRVEIKAGSQEEAENSFSKLTGEELADNFSDLNVTEEIS